MKHPEDDCFPITAHPEVFSPQQFADDYNLIGLNAFMVTNNVEECQQDKLVYCYCLQLRS